MTSIDTSTDTTTRKLWQYTAINKDGGNTQGKIRAASAEEAREELIDRGLLDPQVKRTSDRSYGSGVASDKTKDQFLNYLAAYINAGFTDDQAFEAAKSQVKQKSRFGDLLNKMYEKLLTNSLSAVFSEYEEVWGAPVVRAISGGEDSGNVGEVLNLVVDQKNSKQEVRTKVRKIIRSPLSTLAMLTAFFLLAVLKLIPDAVDVNTELGFDEVPSSSQLALDARDFLLSYWVLIAFLSASVAGIFVYLRQHPHWGLRLSHYTLHMPLFGKALKLQQESFLASQLGLGFSANVPEHQVLLWAAESTDNKWLRSELLLLQREVFSGRWRLHEAFEETPGVVPIQFVYLAKLTATESGNEKRWFTFGDELRKLTLKRIEALEKTLPLVMQVLMMSVIGWLFIAMIEPSLVPLNNLSQLSGGL